MGDKEPRRRKKNRRDSQKKDDVRSEDHFFVLPKSESKDSDQEPEEETVIHSNQPSSMAKIVFVILFSGLVLSLSFIFIALKDVDRDSGDIFDVGHGDHGDAVHDEHLQDVLHDEHLEEALRDEHPEETLQEDQSHDNVQEEGEIRIENFLSGWSSMLSLNTDPAIEIEPESSSSTVQVKEEEETDDLDIATSESSTDQGILEEYLEPIAESPSIEIPEVPSSTEIYPETTTVYSVDETSYSSYDYSEPEDISTTTTYSDAEDGDGDDDEQMMLNMPTTVAENVDEDLDDELDTFNGYDRADITSQADYEIRDQFDDIDGMLEKESNDDDNEEDDVNGNDDDDEEIVEEEFDFWQF